MLLKQYSKEKRPPPISTPVREDQGRALVKPVKSVVLSYYFLRFCLALRFFLEELELAFTVLRTETRVNSFWKS